MSAQTSTQSPGVERDARLEEQRQHLKRGDITSLTALAEEEDLHLEIQLELVKTNLLPVLLSLAWNELLQPQAQLLLIEIDHPDINTTLARNSSTVPEIQAILARKVDLEVRSALVNAPHISSETVQILWDRMLEDGYGKKPLCGHPSLPLDLLDVAANGDETLRYGAASNPQLTLQQQEALAADVDPDVREALAANKVLDPKLAAILFEDETLRRTIVLSQNLSRDLQVRASMGTEAKDHAALRYGVNDPQCTPEFGALYVRAYDTQLYWKHVKDLEAARPLIEQWPGSLADFAEAIALTQR